MSQKEEQQAQSTTGLGLSGSGVTNPAVSLMASELKAMLAKYADAIKSQTDILEVADTAWVANNARFGCLINPYSGLAATTAALTFLGPGTRSGIVGQDGGAATVLPAAAAAAAMVNSVLSKEHAGFPFNKSHLQSLLMLASSVVVALKNPTQKKYEQLTTNLTPRSIHTHGTGAKAVCAAITLLSCQTIVHGRLMCTAQSGNEAGVGAPARFDGVDKMVELAGGRQAFKGSEVTMYVMHVLGSVPLPKYKKGDTCPLNVLRLRVWSAVNLTDVFERVPNDIPDQLMEDAVVRRMRDSGDESDTGIMPDPEKLKLFGYEVEQPVFAQQVDELIPAAAIAQARFMTQEVAQAIAQRSAELERSGHTLMAQRPPNYDPDSNLYRAPGQLGQPTGPIDAQSAATAAAGGGQRRPVSSLAAAFAAPMRLAQEPERDPAIVAMKEAKSWKSVVEQPPPYGPDHKVAPRIAPRWADDSESED
jgi:hypothetical protein